MREAASESPRPDPVFITERILALSGISAQWSWAEAYVAANDSCFLGSLLTSELVCVHYVFVCHRQQKKMGPEENHEGGSLPHYGFLPSKAVLLNISTPDTVNQLTGLSAL